MNSDLPAISPAPRYKLVIFDFDGTLADSGPWFMEAVNRLAVEFHFKPLLDGDRECVRSYHTRQILAHLGIPFWKLPRIVNRLRRLAAEESFRIPLFPGVETLFSPLRTGGLRTAIVTSNAEQTVRKILGVRLASQVDHLLCGASLFGKAAKLHRLLRGTGVSPDEAVYIGDEIRDAEAAREAKVAFAAVGWGYADPEALLALNPALFFRTVHEIPGKLGCPPLPVGT